MKYIIKLTILLTTFTMMSCGKISFTNKQLSQPEQLTFVANESGTSKDSLALNKLAKQTVVEIVSEGYSVEGNKYIPKGSGVIIGRKDSVYYVLTTNHISNVNDELSVFIPGEKPEKGLEVTPLKFINRYPQEDLALLAFASLTDYRVMDLGEVSQLDDDSQVYIAGWAGYDNREGFQFTPTKVTNSQMGNNLTYKSTEPEEAFYKEMSGGAVLNKAGQLVGIHAGLAKADGDGKGVLISTFLRMVSPEVKDLLLRATPTVTLESLTVKNSENVALSPTRDAEITPISYRGIFLRILQVFVLLLLLYFFFIVFYLHIYSCWKKNLNAKNYFHQGLKHHNQEEYDLAIAKYNQAILLHPKYADAYNNRGNIYDHQGKYDLALADYSQAIQLEPKYAKVYYNRGIIYSNQGKYDLALADYNKAIQLKPKYANAYNNRGNIYDNQGKYDLALADYNQAIQLEPRYAEPYNNRGWAYDNQGKYDLALADYNQAIQLHPRYVKAYNNRGIVYSNQGKYDLAIADYNKAIQLYPKYAHAYYNRGLVNKTKGNTERAILDFEKAAELYKEEENQRSYQGSLEQLKELQPVYGDQEKSEKEEVFTFQVVRVNDSGKIINRTQKSVRQKIEDLGNDVRLEIVYIPEGSFIMGSP
ncbi:MAG: tetratricopeptide repeat protein, partial [Trichodesmium sp. MAG_R02]|nr:tetratricopeptide repeat protein [Trichodesmium sp. MAG_R02]